jgi:tetratricopeptide (TPR) repeat protein
MNNGKIYTKFKISFDNDFINRFYDVTPAQTKMLKEMTLRVHGKIDKIFIRKLEKLAKENPNLPQIKNFITVAYYKVGDTAKSIEVNTQILHDFPDYLHARLNAANHHIHKDQPDHALDYLGENLDLGTLFPNRSEFHFSEVQSYYYTTVIYAIAKRDLPLAENRFEVYISIDEDNPRIDELAERIADLKFDLTIDKHNEISKRIGNEPPVTDRIMPPVFIHQEIHQLYQLGFKDSEAVLDEILALPKATVIQDLEMVLRDGIERYPHFLEEDWSVFTHSFALHAMFLLMELKATASLKPVLDFLHYDEEFLEFYIGDFLTDDIWQCVYVLGKDQPKLLKEFLMQTGNYCFAKSLVSQAIVQISIQEPRRTAEIEQVFLELLSFFISTNEDNNVIDPTFIALMIGDIGDGKFVNLYSLIKKLYDLDCVDFSLEGDYDNFVKNIEASTGSSYSLQTLREIYQSANFCEETGSDDSSYLESPFNESKVIQMIPATTVKVQRNDTCPCGSGKKFKKCCG